MSSEHFAFQFEQACDEVEAWLRENHPTAQLVDRHTLVRHGLAKLYTGWKLTVPEGEIVVALPFDFPYRPPRVSVIDADLWKDPHTEKYGRLCLAGDTVRVNSFSPVEQIDETIVEARSLLQDNAQGKNDDDYMVDFRAYWDRSATSARLVYSLIEDAPGTRSVVVYSNSQFDFIAESDAAARHWLSNRFGPSRFRLRRGLLIWCDPLPSPKEYPDSFEDVRKLAGSDGSLLDEVVMATQQETLILLRGPMPDSLQPGGVVIISADPKAPLRRRRPMMGRLLCRWQDQNGWCGEQTKRPQGPLKLAFRTR